MSLNVAGDVLIGTYDFHQSIIMDDIHEVQLIRTVLSMSLSILADFSKYILLFTNKYY